MNFENLVGKSARKAHFDGETLRVYDIAIVNAEITEDYKLQVILEDGTCYYISATAFGEMVFKLEMDDRNPFIQSDLSYYRTEFGECFSFVVLDVNLLADGE